MNRATKNITTMSRIAPLSYIPIRSRSVAWVPPIAFQKRSFSESKQQNNFTLPQKNDATFRGRNVEEPIPINRFALFSVLLTLGVSNYLVWILYRNRKRRAISSQYSPSTTYGPLTWYEMIHVRNLIDDVNAREVNRVQASNASYRMLIWDELVYLRDVDESMNAFEVLRIEAMFPSSEDRPKATANEQRSDPSSSADETPSSTS